MFSVQYLVSKCFSFSRLPKDSISSMEELELFDRIRTLCLHNKRSGIISCGSQAYFLTTSTLPVFANYLANINWCKNPVIIDQDS